MEREDLGMLAGRLTAYLIKAEKPLLEAEGLSMWPYVVISELMRRPGSTQVALADAIGYDKSRLVPLLDELEGRGLITRTPDPSDRRARRLELTSSGRDAQARTQRSIRMMESAMLSELDPGEGDALIAALTRLLDRRRAD